MKRPTQLPQERVPGDVLLHDDWLANDLPLLWAHLTDDKWDDGKPRKTSSITVFVDEGCVKACLSDRDGGFVAFVSGDGLEAVLDALETGLRDESLEWKKARGGSGGKWKKSS